MALRHHPSRYVVRGIGKMPAPGYTFFITANRHSMKEADVMARYSARKPTSSKATISCEGRVAEGDIVNLSVPGCQLRTSLSLQEGRSVQLRVHLSNQPAMRIDLGVVRWTVDGEAGIEFIRMSAEDQSRLRWYVGYADKRPKRSRAWSETALWTGISGA